MNSHIKISHHFTFSLDKESVVSRSVKEGYFFERLDSNVFISKQEKVTISMFIA